MRPYPTTRAATHRSQGSPITGLPLLLCAVSVAACVGQIGDRDEGGPGDDGTGEAKSPQCANLDPGTSPIRRLTRVEYDNTVRDLLGDETHPAQSFAAEEESLGFNNQATALNVTQLHAEQYLEAAEALAATAVEDLGKLTGCDPAEKSEAECAEAFIVGFGKKAFRRPVDAEELERYRTLFDVWSGDGYQTAIRIVLTAILQSPHFLYRVEFGMPDPVEEDVVELDQYEVASRLSYLLWNSMPDDELFSAADAGKLESREEIRAQAERMLADPRARQAVANFHAQWLGLGGMDSLVKDTEMYPSYDDSLRELWKSETEEFVNHVVFDGDGDMTTLFTADYTLANAELAGFYGLSGPGGAKFEKVAVDAEQRAGFLTHASILAINAKTNQTSPVHRGQFVRERLLCQILPPPPDDVDINPPAIDPDATTRERFSQHSEDPACSGCHQLMDPIGFGFENYDGIGLWRTKEGTQTVDASGEVIDGGDAAGEFVGAVELARRLAESETVRQCVTTQWFRFAFGRAEEEADSCSIDTAYEAFEASGFDIQTLLLALTQTDAFLYRKAVVP